MAMAVSVFYLLLIGSPVSAERAVVMICVVMLAVMIDREPFSLRLAAFAAFVVLLLQPEKLVGPSFQMSFSAVVALIAFYEATRDKWREGYEDDRDWPRRYSLYMIACLLTTVVASLATAPYSLYHFLRVPLLSGIVANMIAVPVSFFITMPFGLIGCLLIPAGMEEWPLRITGWSIDVLMTVARETASWPHAAVTADAWPAWMLGVVTLGGLWLCIWQGRVRYVGLIPIVFVLVMIPNVERPDVLVSGEDFLYAVRDADQRLLISSARRQKFIRKEWQEREGNEGTAYIGAGMSSVGDADAQSERLTCDEHLCTYRKNGVSVAFADDDEALGQACGAAQVVFTSQRQDKEMPCAAHTVVDKDDLRYGGAHALFIGDNGSLMIRTVKQSRGNRPWVNTTSIYIKH